MKNLTGPIILLSAFSLAVAVAEPPAAKPSEKLGMIDTLSAVATDTMTLDSFRHVGMPVMTSGKWFYTPVAEMPDP